MQNSDTNLSMLLKELMGKSGKTRGKLYTLQHSSRTIEEKLRVIQHYRRIYEALKEVIEPEPCPLYDASKGRCKVKELGGGLECRSTKPYRIILNTLMEAGIRKDEAVKLIERLERLGWLKACNPVVRSDGTAAAKGAILGALLGALAGPAGVVLGATMGGTAGWLIGEEKRYEEKRVVFLK